MPLLKRKPFSLLEPLNDLDPKEKIFQVRFTKEIFRDYQYPFSDDNFVGSQFICSEVCFSMANSDACILNNQSENT
jgi:hypothetical protein